ncbi:alpha/beta hydrolase family protein [Microbacterium sp. NIBRBAC000506063]|uniref:alpha/beta hydrolase family protein n=1 Tax=Microbacterium sp. NIBRBAC000506063 TaxID=2734618 RepID=UPI001BB707D4|nr:alpha/beta fold hydrolase [Microbacterium sp. NIBRBAC000506063]QTV79735.1 alpha/beta fold hydrolase [Microbacterium sp. NIBRBAC000506063]
MKSLRHAARAALTLLLALVAAGSLLALVVFRIARSVVTPSRRKPDLQILAIDTSAQTIELTRTADTELPGRYGLLTSGTYDYIKIGAVLSTGPMSVRRKLLTKIDASARVDKDAAFSGWYYASPSELHLPYESVIIGAPHGPCPAWFFPSERDTWVIQVHGRGTTRAECLRAVPVFQAEGFPVLVVSYRNDGEAARSRSGAYGLGSTEWHDVDAAIGHALRHGARRVILMGWSMGGAIVLQALTSSVHRERIAGVVLESPVVDWRPVLDFHAKLAGMRDPLPALALGALSSDLTARLSGAEAAIPFDRLDMVARSAELGAPVLLLHSDDDGFVPSDASHALAEARPDLVTMKAFTVARHTKLWNYDQQGWTKAITDWLSGNGFLNDSAGD